MLSRTSRTATARFCEACPCCEQTASDVWGRVQPWHPPVVDIAPLAARTTRTAKSWRASDASHRKLCASERKQIPRKTEREP